VQIGACSDDQTAADTAALSQTAYTGAATYTFIDSVEKFGTQQSYGILLLHMTQSLARLGKTSVKPASTGAQVAGGALPVAMAIALGPIGEGCAAAHQCILPNKSVPVSCRNVCATS
jgi:hypothetical protein